MVRTTLNLEPSVLAELKRRSKRERRPLGEVASEELARAFKAREPVASPLSGWKTYDMGEPAVALEDKEALEEFLESTDPHDVPPWR
jgi:hypothetical protein